MIVRPDKHFSLPQSFLHTKLISRPSLWRREDADTDHGAGVWYAGVSHTDTGRSLRESCWNSAPQCCIAWIQSNERGSGRGRVRAECERGGADPSSGLATVQRDGGVQVREPDAGCGPGRLAHYKTARAGRRRTLVAWLRSALLCSRRLVRRGSKLATRSRRHRDRQKERQRKAHGRAHARVGVS